jgi:hypothetical protein
MKKKEILFSLFSLFGWVGLTGCKEETVFPDYEISDGESGYEEVIETVYARLSDKDGKATLPTAGRYTYRTEYGDCVIEIEKVEYTGWAIKSYGQIWLDIRIYCTVVLLRGNAANLVLKCYNGDGYLTYAETLYRGGISSGDKFVWEYGTDLNLNYEDYQSGGLRIEFENVDE